MKDIFRKFSTWASEATGTVWAFGLAGAVILVWAATGPMFKFGATWQLVINTSTTIITFLMVFLIQSTQNRDNSALHAKLDELIVHTKGAHDELATAKNFTDEQLKELKAHYLRVAQHGGTSASDPWNIPGLSQAANGAAKENGAAKKPATTRRRKPAAKR